MIWGMTTPLEIRKSGLYDKEREEAMQILLGNKK